MKIPPASSLTLVIGLAIGFLATRALDSPHGSDSGKTSASQPDRSEILRQRGAASSKSSKRSKLTGGGASATGKLTALLNLTNASHGSSGNVEFYQAIERLDPGEIIGILADLDATKGNDPRAYKIRNALFGQWAKTDPTSAWAAALEMKNTGFRSQAISAVVGELSLVDLDQAKHLISDLENPQDKQAALQAFIVNAVSRDPLAAFELVAKEGSNRTNYLYHTLFFNWTKNDPAGAIAQLGEIKGRQQRQQALSSIANALASEDPDRAIAFAMGLENKGEVRNALNNVIGTIAGNDPQRALKLAESLPDGRQRRQALSQIASSWVQTDPDAALAWIETLPPGERMQALQQGMWQIINNDVAKAVKLLESMPLGNQSSQLYSQVASQWVQTDPDAAIKWVNGLPQGRVKDNAVGGMINELAQSDPRKAATFLEESGINRNNSYQIGNIVAAWEATEPGAALVWMDGLQLQGDERKNAISNAVSQLAGLDPERAAEYVMTLPDTERQNSVGALMNGWANFDPDAAREWAMSNLDGDTKVKAVGSIIQSLSYQDLRSAISMYDEMTPTLSREDFEKHFSNTASQIANSWAQYDPEGAGKWLSALPEGDHRANAVSQLVDNWGDNDVDGAANFVLTLHEGKERDQAVERLVQDVQHVDPEAAFQWAESIGDEQRRDQMIRQAAAQWNSSDPDAVRDALSTANISDQMRERIIKGLE